MIAFFLGIPIPDIIERNGRFYPTGTTFEADEITVKDINHSFESDNYWRVMFAIPIGISILQVILLLTSFNYETPKFMKQNGENGKLNELMGKIYDSERIEERIRAITIETGKA